MQLVGYRAAGQWALLLSALLWPHGAAQVDPSSGSADPSPAPLAWAPSAAPVVSDGSGLAPPVVNSTLANSTGPPVVPPVAPPLAPLVPPTVVNVTAPMPPQGFLFPKQLPPALTTPPTPASVLPCQRPKGMLTLRTMRITGSPATNAHPVQGAKLFFGMSSEFAVGTDAAGNFVVAQEKDTGEVPVMLLDGSNTLHLNSERVQVASLDAAQGLSVRGVKQWQLVYAEDFFSQAPGWSHQEISQCAGVHMLGGFCKLSSGEVNKTFPSLPPHTQLRVVATYHFIDRWIGETGYMRLSTGLGGTPVTVWSEMHYQQESRNGLSLCGQSNTPEGKFAVSIDVTVPHFKDSVTLTFGSTMQDTDPCDESWGVSGVELHVRSA